MAERSKAAASNGPQRILKIKKKRWTRPYKKKMQRKKKISKEKNGRTPHCSMSTYKSETGNVLTWQKHGA
jgi:hypothetical protein